MEHTSPFQLLKGCVASAIQRKEDGAIILEDEGEAERELLVELRRAELRREEDTEQCGSNQPTATYPCGYRSNELDT